jgi:hypothetical protein
MGDVPLVFIRLTGDETLGIEDMLAHAGLPNRERLHSKRITIEYYPEEKRATVVAVKYQENKNA